MLDRIRVFFSRIDFALLIPVTLLVGIGILSIYSVGITAEGFNVSNEYLKQIFWAATAFLLAFLVAAIDYQRYKEYSFILYALFLVLLIYTRLAGRVVNGARSWIGIGELGIQPSEFAKIACILYLAQYLSSSVHQNQFRRLITSFIIIGIPVLLILSQPDFGTSLVFFPILISMTFAAKLPRKYVVFIVLFLLLTFVLLVMPLWEQLILKTHIPILFVFYTHPYSYMVLAFLMASSIIAGYGWITYRKTVFSWISYVSILMVGTMTTAIMGNLVLKEYQIMRLMVFLNPNIDPKGSGWNIIQAITAIGSGGFTGKGFLQGTQSHYRYIPQQSTDFIFSIVAEEWGFLGGGLVFALYYAIQRRCITLMASVKDPYASYLAAGAYGMFFFHFMINAGMVMGIMPITGIPLHFLSYGGSSLWSVMTVVGILLGISARRYRQ